MAPDPAALSGHAVRPTLTPKVPAEANGRKEKATRVRNVLNIKGSTVVSVAVDVTVHGTLWLFAEAKIGCVTVTDVAGWTIGLDCERDI